MNKKDIRAIERVSIRDFISRHEEYLWGRVLDFGCGTPSTCVQPQPYRHIIDGLHTRLKQGEYVPHEKGEPMPSGPFDCVLMTQVLQYIEHPARLLFDLHERSHYLLMTYPTHWEEVEASDLWRFTKCGVDKMLRDAGWKVLEHQVRWTLPFDDFKLAGGYGVLAES